MISVFAPPLNCHCSTGISTPPVSKLAGAENPVDSNPRGKFAEGGPTKDITPLLTTFPPKEFPPARTKDPGPTSRSISLCRVEDAMAILSS